MAAPGPWWHGPTPANIPLPLPPASKRSPSNLALATRSGALCNPPPASCARRIRGHLMQSAVRCGGRMWLRATSGHSAADGSQKVTNFRPISQPPRPSPACPSFDWLEALEARPRVGQTWGDGASSLTPAPRGVRDGLADGRHEIERERGGAWRGTGWGGDGAPGVKNAQCVRADLRDPPPRPTPPWRRLAGRRGTRLGVARGMDGTRREGLWRF